MRALRSRRCVLGQAKGQQRSTYQAIRHDFTVRRTDCNARTMAARTIHGAAGLKEVVGEHLGYSDWMEITQDRVNKFADATGDHQWIHVDPSGPRRRARSAARSPTAT